jgi:hypothetical protein
LYIKNAITHGVPNTVIGAWYIPGHEHPNYILEENKFVAALVSAPLFFVKNIL